MASVSSAKRNSRATLATSNNIYLPTPYTTPPLQRQCLSDSLQSFNPSHGSGSSSWMLWRDPNSPAYYQGENKGRICGVLLAVVVFLVIVAVLAIAGLAVYMGALRIDTSANKNNTKQQKLIKDDRSLEIRNGVLRKVSSNHNNFTTPQTIHLKKMNASETEPIEDLPVIQGSFRISDTELNKGNKPAENKTESHSEIAAENSEQLLGTARADAKNVTLTVDDVYIVGGAMEVKVKKTEENDRNFTKSSNFERHQSGNIQEVTTKTHSVTVIREENTKAPERESEERSYSQRSEIKTNSSAASASASAAASVGVESGSTRTRLVLESLPTKIIQEKEQTVLQVGGAQTERLGLPKHENTTNTLSTSTKSPPPSTQRAHVTFSQENAAKKEGTTSSAEKNQPSRENISVSSKIKPKLKSEPVVLPEISAVRSLSNDTIEPSISDEATFQTRFPPRQRVTVLPDQRNASHNVSSDIIDSKNASSADTEEEVAEQEEEVIEEEDVDIDPNSMLRRMGPVHPAPEQDVGKGSQIRYSDPSQSDRGNAMVLNPAGPVSQNNPMNPTVLSTNTYKDRYQHLSAASKFRPHYGTKIVDAQVRDSNPSKEDLNPDKNTKNSGQRVDGGAVVSVMGGEISALPPVPVPALVPAPVPAPAQDTGTTIEDGWRPIVPADFAMVSHRPDMDQHEHTLASQTSDNLSRVHLQVSNANQDMPASVLHANVNGSVSFARNNSSSTDRPGTLLTAQGNSHERNITKSNAAEVIRKIIAESYNWPELPIMQQFSNLGNFLRKDDKPIELSRPQTTIKVVSSTTTKRPKTSTTERTVVEEEIENHGIALPVDSLPAELLIEEKSTTVDVTKSTEIVVQTLKPPKSNSGIGRPLRPRPKPDTTTPTIPAPTTPTSPTPTETLPQSTASSTNKTPPKAQQRPSIYSITTTKTSKITTPLKSAVRSNRTKTTTSTRPEQSSPAPLDVVTRKSIHVSYSDDKTKKDDRRNETTHYVKINVRQENKVPNRSNGVGSHNAYHILPPKTVTTRPKSKGPVRITTSNGTVRISTVPPRRRNGTSSAAKITPIRKENTTLVAASKPKHDPSNIASKMTETNFYPVTYFPLLMNTSKHVGESHRHPKMSVFNDSSSSSSSSQQTGTGTVTERATDKQVGSGTEIRMSLEDIVRNYRTKITSSQNSKSNRNYSITYDELQEKQNSNAQEIGGAAADEVSEIRHQHKESANKSRPLTHELDGLPEPTQNTPKVIVSASSRVQDRTVETNPSDSPAHYLLSPSNGDSKTADLGTSKLFQNYPKIIQSFSPGMQNSAIGIRNSSSDKYVSKLTTHLPFTTTTKILPNNDLHRTNQTPIENRFTESFHSSYKENSKYNPTTPDKIVSTLEINKPSHRENDKDMNYETFKDSSFPLEDAIVNAISKFATVHVSTVVKNISAGIFNSQHANADTAGYNVTEGSLNMTATKHEKNTTSQKEWSKANTTWLSSHSKENSSEEREKLPPNFTLNQNGIPILTKTYTKATDTQLSNAKDIQDEMEMPELNMNQTECTGLICGNNECVAAQSRCNQLVDCSDGADEKDCTCADYLKAQYLTRKLCDGVVDCWDFTDENNCEWCSPGQFVCPNSQMCIDREKLCDGNRDCPYGDDEKQCVTIAPTLRNATDFPYHQEGFLMVRKQGKWGKLCLQNFNSVVSDSHTTWEVKDLGKAVCKAMTFSDFDRVERMVDTTGRSDENSLYYELSYSPEDTNASTARSSLTFHESPCAQKEVVHVKCRDLECGIRPQAVSQWARSRRSRIVGGGNSGPGSWPWQAALYKEGEFQCGATLISEQWLVSAGHCFYHALDDYWVARLGTLRRGTNFPSPYEQLRPISNIILHPRYVDSGFINDISLLRMKEPVAFSDYVRPICLPQPNSVLKDGKLCTVVGWGQLFEVGRIFPDTLQEVQLPIISTGECRKRTLFLPLYRVTDNMFCAGFDRGGRDACLGDSGGPLMCQEADGHWSLYGVTSNGYGCARANRPGVYTKVAKYVVWIRTSMNLLMQLRESKAACKGHRCPLGECLPRSRVCNGYMECSDGSDEKDCW